MIYLECVRICLRLVVDSLICLYLVWINAAIIVNEHWHWNAIRKQVTQVPKWQIYIGRRSFLNHVHNKWSHYKIIVKLPARRRPERVPSKDVIEAVPTDRWQINRNVMTSLKVVVTTRTWRAAGEVCEPQTLIRRVFPIRGLEWTVAKLPQCWSRVTFHWPGAQFLKLRMIFPKFVVRFS